MYVYLLNHIWSSIFRETIPLTHTFCLRITFVTTYFTKIIFYDELCIIYHNCKFTKNNLNYINYPYNLQINVHSLSVCNCNFIVFNHL